MGTPYETGGQTGPFRPLCPSIQRASPVFASSKASSSSTTKGCRHRPRVLAETTTGSLAPIRPNGQIHSSMRRSPTGPRTIVYAPITSGRAHEAISTTVTQPKQAMGPRGKQHHPPYIVHCPETCIWTTWSHHSPLLHCKTSDIMHGHSHAVRNSVACPATKTHKLLSRNQTVYTPGPCIPLHCVGLQVLQQQLHQILLKWDPIRSPSNRSEQGYP